MVEEQAYKLKKLLAELGAMKGRHTELVSVYIPAKYPLNEIMGLIANEISLTQNVKSKTVRKNVIDALTKVQQHLKLFKRTPEAGLVIFCGNVSEREGESDIKLWSIEPPEPVPIKLYWCDQKFELGPLQSMVAEKEIYGLVVMDLQECTIGLLKGKAIQVLRHMNSIVPGKTGKGGQSSQRFERVREGLTNDWLKMVAENIRSYLDKPEIKGIILGGSGPMKNTLFKEDYLLTQVKKKIIGVVDTGYTDEHGLSELIERGQDLLKEASIAKEKALMQKFLTELQKNSGLVVYGVVEVIRAIELGAVEILLLSEKFSWPEFEYLCSCGFAQKKFVKPGLEREQKCSQCGKTLGIVGQKDPLDAVEELAKNFNTHIEVISADTPEGQKLEAIGGIGAILRYKIQ